MIITYEREVEKNQCYCKLLLAPKMEDNNKYVKATAAGRMEYGMVPTYQCSCYLRWRSEIVSLDLSQQVGSFLSLGFSVRL
jgi:hypothetical protein